MTVVEEAASATGTGDSDPASATSGVGLPRAPEPQRAPRNRKLKFTARRVVAVGLAIVIILVLQQHVVGPLILQQRQQHLAAQLSQPSPAVKNGDALGVIQLPSIGVNSVIVEGVTDDHLRSGPAHVAGSALPGGAGVMVIMAHRDAYGGTFEKVDSLIAGETVVVQARNNGPIVPYTIDRLERNTSVAALTLEDTDTLAYVLLVTGDDGFLTTAETIVIAHTLPVTDAPAVQPDLAADSDDGAPFGVELLLALGSMTAVFLAFQFLRGRAGRMTVALVLSPIAAYATVRLLMVFDAVLPLLR